MEKLIKLLNEYEKGDVWSYDEEMGMPYYGWGDDCDYDTYLISKKYGFIKWLVEHNKLLHPDFVQHLKLFYGDSMPEYNFYLMMLSIADRPIAELNKMLRP